MKNGGSFHSYVSLPEHNFDHVGSMVPLVSHIRSRAMGLISIGSIDLPWIPGYFCEPVILTMNYALSLGLQELFQCGEAVAMSNLRIVYVSSCKIFFFFYYRLFV